MFDLSFCFIWAAVEGLKIHAKHNFFYSATVWAIDWALKWHGWARPNRAGLGVIKKTNLLNGVGSQGGFGHKETHLKVDPLPFLIVE